MFWLMLGLSALALLGRELPGGGAEQRRTDTEGLTRAEALRSPKLYLLIVVSFILSAACGVQQQLPSMLLSYGFAPERVGVMMSFFAATLALGKVGQGLFYGRVGALRGGMLITGIFALSFWIMRFPATVWLGLAALALGMGTVTTLLPLLTRLTFGGLEYASIWGIVYSAANVGTLAATPLYGLAYDTVGSYGAAMMVSMVVIALCLGLLRLISPKK